MSQPNHRSGPRALFGPGLGLSLAVAIAFGPAAGCGDKLAETDTATVVADPKAPPSRPATPAASADPAAAPK